MTEVKRILRIQDVENKIGLKRGSIYKLAREGKLPKPRRISTRASGWLESEIDAFIDERMAQGGDA